MSQPGRAGLGAYVRACADTGELAVQPRMGMGPAGTMAAGLRAVASARARTVGTITLDSYTRVGDHASAQRTLAAGADLNGFPIIAHGPAVTAAVAAAAGPGVPVQVRHGSARPESIFAAMAASGLSDSEGGPVSYCLPYGRTPLAESVSCWAAATERLAGECAARDARAHLETFGGCLLGQLCPPSLLVAISVLEGLFFVQHGVRSISLSYAQQASPVQDIEALAALRELAGALLPPDVDWHLVLYTYMGVFPATADGARNLLAESAEIAVRGGAERLIVKTTAEAHRIPTIAENIAALEAAAGRARWARAHSPLPAARQVDCGDLHAEASALITAVLEQSDDIGRALRMAFAAGLLDVPFCLHRDNHGRSQGAIGPGGRLIWARTGGLPLPARARPADRPITSATLLGMLRYVADRHDRLGADQPDRMGVSQ
jgi:methylaspartate mutase epsilon subunit